MSKDLDGTKELVEKTECYFALNFLYLLMEVKLLLITFTWYLMRTVYLQLTVLTDECRLRG